MQLQLSNLPQMGFPVCYNEPLPHYSIFCLHLVKWTSYSALQDWSIPHYTKYLSCFNALPAAPCSLAPHSTAFSSLCLTFSLLLNLLPIWLSLFLFQSLFPPLSTHSLSLFSVPIFLCVCVSFSLPFSLSPCYSCAFHRSKAE